MLLTRIKIPYQVEFSDSGSNNREAWAYPAVGLVLGVLVALVVAQASKFGLSPALQAALCVLLLVLLTGAMHEDGLADSADGLWGGWSTERRLEIMKDSRIGVYGVLALVFSILIRFLALWAAFEAEIGAIAVVAAASVSRFSMVWVMYSLPSARSSGLSHSTGKPEGQNVIAAAVVSFLCLALLLGTGAIWPGLTAIVVTLGWQTIAKSKIGGQTGDILGASQQLCEIAILVSIAAMI